MPATRNYRKRRNPDRGAEENDQNVPSDNEEQSRLAASSSLSLSVSLPSSSSPSSLGILISVLKFGFVRLALEEVKFLQKQRERKLGIPAFSTVQAAVGGLPPKAGEKVEGGDGEKDDLVLQDTFAQETAVTIEDPNMLKYIEQELAKKRGKTINSANQVENDLKSAEDELYAIPEHLKVKKRNSEESSTQWTTGIAEVQLPIEYKLKNIEETEAAKKLLQEKRLAGRTKTELSIPSSYSADFFQRGRDYAERLRREHPELYKERAVQDNSGGPKSSDTTSAETAGRRQAATDEFMLERFRKRERNRVMRR